MKHWAIAILAITGLSGAPALAKERMHHSDYRGDRGDYHRVTIDALKNRDQALQHKMLVMRQGPAGQEQIAEQRRQIDDLIDDLEAGRSVSPHELDEALGYPYHGYHHHHHFEGRYEG